ERCDGLRLRSRRPRHQSRQGVAACESSAGNRNTVDKRSGELHVGDGVLIDEVIGDAVAAAEDKPTVPGIPGKADAWSGIPVAVEHVAADVNSAERSGADCADRSCVVRIEVGNQVGAFRYASGRLQAVAEIQSKCVGDTVVILHEKEGVKG